MSETFSKSAVKKKPARSGLVRYYIHASSDKLAEAAFAPSDALLAMGSGLPVAELSDLQENLDVPVERLAPMLGISKATYHRNMLAGGKLKPAVSDRVVRYARLLGKAVQVFGGMEDAKQWLGSTQFGLGGAVPLEYAKSELGAREVENLLGRIEHGVYS